MSLAISAERIGAKRSTPSVLWIDHRCHTDLRRTLLAPYPEEDCALLQGQRVSSERVSLTTVWPCCNVWGRGRPGQHVHGRRRRFLVDPRLQLVAQRWARDGFNVVWAWPTPIRRPSPCPRSASGAREKLKAWC